MGEKGGRLEAGGGGGGAAGSALAVKAVEILQLWLGIKVPGPEMGPTKLGPGASFYRLETGRGLGREGDLFI